MKKCWVCLRITSAKTLKLAHQVWSENQRIARKIGLKASNIIQDAYLTNPIFFCGQSSKATVSGLFWLLGFQFEAAKSMKDISFEVGITETTVKRSYRRWLSNFPKLFPAFGFENTGDVDLSRVRLRLYPTFKEKRVNQFYKEASE